MIANAGKTCSKCGEAKPLSEFYAHDNGHSKWQGRKSVCKTCCKTKNAKRRSEKAGREYVPRPEDWGTLTPQCSQCGGRVSRYGVVFCAKCRTDSNMDVVSSDEYEVWMATADRGWLRCLLKCRQRAIAKGKSRHASRDPWLRKMVAIESSCRHRKEKTKPACKSVKNSTGAITWNAGLKKTIAQARVRENNVRHRGAWYRKFDTMARNWRRKAAEDLWQR